MVALRTNPTVRQLAAVFAISTSQAHRIIDRHTRLIAALFATSADLDRCWSWTLDGTLIPTRDHRTASQSNNYRYSTNAHVLSRRHDLAVVAICGGGPGNRNDLVHYRASELPEPAVSHGRVLAASSYRDGTELHTPTLDGRSIRRDQVRREHRPRRARAQHTKD